MAKRPNPPKASATAAQFGTEKAGSGQRPCLLADAKIVSIAWLDGTDAKTTAKAMH
jgi:hypothetical protein